MIDFRVNDRNLHDVASVRLHGAENEGWKANSYCGYAVDWAFDHMGATDANALCASWPVGLEPLHLPHWPVFLIDMLPECFGLQELLQRTAPLTGLKSMAPALEQIAAQGEAIGLDAGVLTHLHTGILAQAQNLSALS